MSHPQGHGPAEVLDAEHEVIRHLLHALDDMARAIEERPLPRADVDDAIDAIMGFADACHHAKEEKVLCPALRRHAPVESERVVRELEGDHEAGRRLVGSMRDSASVQDAAARERFARAAHLYVKLLETHIEHETERLFPLVERVFTPAEREALADEFDRIEREETGGGVHERYEGIVHRLAQEYAS